MQQNKLKTERGNLQITWWRDSAVAMRDTLKKLLNSNNLPAPLPSLGNKKPMCFPAMKESHKNSFYVRAAICYCLAVEH